MKRPKKPVPPGLALLDALLQPYRNPPRTVSNTVGHAHAQDAIAEFEEASPWLPRLGHRPPTGEDDPVLGLHRARGHEKKHAAARSKQPDQA